MADREVNIKINLDPGSDQLTPKLRQQQDAADELARRLAQIKTPAPAPQSLRPSARLDLSPGGGEVARQPVDLLRPANQERSQERQLLQLAQRPPEGVAQQDWSAALQEQAAEQRRRQQRELQERLRPAAGAALQVQQNGGLIPQGEIRPAQPAGGGGGLGGAIGQAVSGVRGIAGSFAGITSAAGAVVPVVGAVTAGVGLLGGGLSIVRGAVDSLTAAFQRQRTSVEELNARLNQSRGINADVRSQGAPGQEQVTGAFANRPGVLRELRQAQAGGNQAEVTRILERERAQATADVQAGAGSNLEEAGDLIRDLLRRQRGRRQEQGGRNADSGEFAEQISLSERLRQMGVRGEGIDLRSTDTRILTDAEIERIAQAPRAGLANAQARRQVAETALREGRLDPLREGAPGVRDLPSLSRGSVGGDVLTQHLQVQQELLRDQREEARFQAQYQLWEQIQRDIAGMARQPAPPPAVG